MRRSTCTILRRLSTAASSTRHQLRATAGAHIDLQELDRGLYRASSSQLWVPPGGYAVFGGQVLGQALHAAQLSLSRSDAVPKDVVPISLHSYFLKRGLNTSDIIYQVRESANLRSFFSRSVDAIQQGEIIFQMQAQFARGGEPSGIAHAEPMPSDLPPPEECPSRADMLAELLTRAPASLRPLIEEAQAVPVEVRYACNRLPDPLDLDPPPQPSRQLLWVRIRDPISSGPGLNEACAAYLSDEPLLLTALRPHSIGFPSPKLGAFATLDHSMWFHAPFRADEWLLYEMSSPHAGAGRALCFGHLYRPDTGQLVVSVAQQGVLRLAKPSLASKAAIAGWRGANLLEWLRAKLGIG